MMTLADLRPIRILHVVGGMRRAGIETWLMQVLQHIDRERFKMDFMVHTENPCAYDDEIRTLASKVIPCLQPSQLLLYDRNFKRILREYGPYDIIHSHVHHFSGYVLRLAQQVSVPIRIAHSHNDTSCIEARAGLYRQLYLALMKRWIAHYATVGLGTSRKALPDLFGQAWKNDPRWQVIYCGIDLAPFRELVNPVSVRAELEIPPDALVIGHVGRFEEQKNHAFLVEVAAEVAKLEPKLCLLLVGDGPLRPEIEQKIALAGLTKNTIFTGVRPDVARLMLGAMDVFLFPSLHEGLGLVLIEAQAARLPCIFSDVIPEEADVIKPLVRRLSLSQTVSEWREAILAAREVGSEITHIQALRLIEQSSFNIQTSVKNLEALYTQVTSTSIETGAHLRT